ncbi:MAG: glycosyltransferase family 2 protein [Geminicoccaceae bacterium]
MSISAVILSFNAQDDLDRCVRSLIAAENLQADNDQILIVDNGSTDGSKALINRLEAAYPDLVEGIDLPTNHGTTVSRNLAFAQARGDYVLVIDSDIDFKRPVLQSLIAELAIDPSIGIIVPRLIFPSGQVQMSTDVFPTVKRKIERLIRLRSLEKQTETNSGTSEIVDYAISAFWLMRRDLLHTVGELDERIFYAPEDVDFCLRTWLSGKKIVYRPDLEVVHDAKERSRSLKGLLFAWRHLMGLAYFFDKHGYFWRTDDVYQRIREAHSGAIASGGNYPVGDVPGMARG